MIGFGDILMVVPREESGQREFRKDHDLRAPLMRVVQEIDQPPDDALARLDAGDAAQLSACNVHISNHSAVLS